MTAGELAGAAGVTPSTASGHLGQMLEAGLLALERQGRHRYYRIASTSVAGLIENLMSVTGGLSAARNRSKSVSTGPRDRALRRARLCYDHLAGEVAVEIAACMVARGQLDLDHDGGIVTEKGTSFLALLGINTPDASAPWRQARLCRPCLDWSERRPHLAGLVGRALYATLLRERWIAAPTQGRAVFVTPLGQRNLERHFGLAPV